MVIVVVVIIVVLLGALGGWFYYAYSHDFYFLYLQGRQAQLLWL